MGRLPGKDGKMKTPREIKRGLRHCSEDGCKECNYEEDCYMADGFSVLAFDALSCIQQLENKVQLLEARNDSLAAKAALFDEAMAAGAKMERERDAALDKLSELLSYASGGRFSKPDYTIEDMKRFVDDYLDSLNAV